MHCARHDDRPAIGTCFWCQKGVCRECVEEVEGVFACGTACEPLARNRLRQLRATGSYYGSWIYDASGGKSVTWRLVVWGMIFLFIILAINLIQLPP